MALPPTPSQTIGPFFHFALLGEARSELVAQDHPSAIRIEGTLYDGAGEVVPDAMLEIWQADADGRYVHPGGDGEGPVPKAGFSGFGRCGTNDEGRYEFLTIKPGSVPGPDGQGTLQAPHIWVSVFARGLLDRLLRRELANDASDRRHERIPDRVHRQLLVAALPTKRRGNQSDPSRLS